MSAYCPFCGQTIAGRGRYFHHPAWAPEARLRICDRCAEERPRCGECGLPLAGTAGAIDASGAGLCADCRRSLRVCLACGKPVAGKSYFYDGIGPYCEVCRQSRPPCDVCGGPLSYEYWELSDGRAVCAACHTTAVYSPEAAASLYAELKEVISTDLGLTLNIPTGLAMVDRHGLRQVIDRQSSGGPKMVTSASPPGALDANHTLGLYARRGMRRGIYIQTGLPRLLFLQVAAHEYGHAWQGENCPLLRDPIIHEGFAEWVAYHVSGRFGDRRGQERMRSRRDVYGNGLRWALAVEAREGPAGVLRACRQSVGAAAG